jgi:hypothetical protein
MRWGRRHLREAIRMKKIDRELSAPAIFGIALAFAIAGATVYALATPIAPVKLIALSHGAVVQTASR